MRKQSKSLTRAVKSSTSNIQKGQECSDAIRNLNQSTDDNDKEKHTAYYSALVEAWINTKMEKDKSLLALSTGGIGVLVTLLTTVGASSRLAAILFDIGLAFFLITIVSAILIFGRNANLIQCLINDEPPKDKDLKLLDKVMFWSFILGLATSVTIGILASIQRISK